MQSLARASMLFLAAFAMLAVTAVSCDRGSGNPATPTPSTGSGTPAPSPTATPPPADPTLADDLRYRGDFEAAADVYGAVAQEETGDARQEAMLAQAQMLQRADRLMDARLVMEAHTTEAGPATEGSTGQYLLASTIQDLGGEDATALDLYSRYAFAGGPLTSYANIERAKLLAALGRGPEAEALAAGVLADASVSDLGGSFSMSMGRAYLAAGLPADALQWFSRAGAYEGFAAASLSSGGAAKQQLGDATWVDDYVSAIAIAPDSGEAASLLDELDVAAVPVSDYVRGVVEYRAFRNDAARASFERAAAAGDNPGEALYYLGALDERAEADDSAIVRYQQAYDADPASTLADSGLWWRGRLLENAERYDEAIADYALLAANYPASEWADGAAFHVGLSQYKAGRLPEAASTWSAIAPQENSEGYRSRLWQGKALRELDDPIGESVLQLLATDNEPSGDYYALRARELLGEEPFDGDVEIDDATPDWDEVAEAIAAPTVNPTISPTAASTREPVDLDADPRWQLAEELEAVGLNSQSDGIIIEMIDDAGPDLELLLAISRRLHEQGDVRYSVSAASALSSWLTGDEPSPPPVRRLLYPPAYIDLVEEAVSESEVDPALMVALMRQESLYDPDAGSTAGALGLVQIIPPTGEAIAADLGVADFKTEDLFRPALNLRFGSHYFASQLSEFDGNVRHALAAYNGGPGASLDAITLAGDDPDLFVEELEFDETRLYVRRVLEHYAAYQELYGDE